MTCIVAYAKDGDIFMGADAGGVDSTWGLAPRKDPKIFISGEFIIGYTSSYRMGQLLRFKLNPPEIGGQRSVRVYVHRFC